MNIENNIAEIQENIRIAKIDSPNPEETVMLVAVSKTRTVEELNAVLAAGQMVLGENRVQELLDKYDKVASGAVWHIIGHLQSNKVKYIIDKVALVHSLESISLAEEISRRMQAVGKVMDCLVQVNIADEESKFGLALSEVVPFIEKVSQMPGIHIKGLMNIAPFFEDTEQVRPIFRAMYQLFISLKEKAIPNVDMDILSMGMSHDYIIAVEEGANMVRVGRYVFK